MRILAVSGSLRAGSHNTQPPARRPRRPRPRASRSSSGKASASCRSTTRISTATTLPDSVRRLREAWAEADAILFATPEYNGSVPGGLKNAIDWASRPVRASGAHEQDGRRDRREHRPVRRHVGAGTTCGGSSASPAPASSATSCRSPARTRSSTTRAACSTASSSSGCGCVLETLAVEAVPARSRAPPN